nr:hypothetical protein [Tanacetum cinerariifolium]
MSSPVNSLSISPGIDKTDCYPEEDIRLTKRLLYDNSSPRPPEEFIFENSNADIESFFPSPIPNEDSDSFMKEIDLTFTPDDPMPPSIEDDDNDSERDILIHEELLDNYSLSLPVIESFYFDIPLFSRPPVKPPDVVQYSQKLEDSCQRILSSKSSFPQLHLGIMKFDFEGWSISITFRFSMGLQTPDDLSRSRLGFIEKMGVHG